MELKKKISTLSPFITNLYAKTCVPTLPEKPKYLLNIAQNLDLK